MQLSAKEIVDIVASSGCLGSSDRQKNLLLYLLEKRELGESKGIKAYNIAIDVLGRPESFDASTDSIVRVEMHRLRGNLKQFNADNTEFSLLLPASSFAIEALDTPQNSVKVFLSRHYKKLALAFPVAIAASFALFQAMPSKSVTDTTLCSSVLPNVSVHHSGANSDLQVYVGKAIRSTLSQYTSLQLIDDNADCSHSGTPNFVLDYMALVREDNTYRIALTTYNERLSNIVSFKNIGGVIATPKDEDELYRSIDRHLGNLAKPYGLIPNFAVTVGWDSDISRTNYQCLITMYGSFVTDSHSAYKASVECLERSVASGTATLDNTGGLIASYVAQKHTRNPSVENPMQLAKKMIDEVGTRWVESVEMIFAKAAYEAERDDYNAERLKDLLSTAEANYPANPLVLITSSTYTGFKLGDWERAKSLSDRAIRIHAEKDNSVYSVQAAYAFLHNKPEHIMPTCVLTYSENSLLSNLIINACARTAGDIKWQDTTELNLKKLNLSDLQAKIDYVHKRQLDPLITTRLISAFQTPLH